MTEIAYFDCFSGISGDMLIGAILDAGVDLEPFRAEMSKLRLNEFELTQKKVMKQHLAATKFEVVDKAQKKYRHPKDLNAIIDNSDFDEDIKSSAKKIFLRIAKAEAKIHNMPVEKVHFHEIGAVDTIVDVVGALVGLRMLGVDKVICSKLNVGTGFVEFSHGRYPAPAPATAEILLGVPVYSNETVGELVTPTGAAIITEIADSFGAMPEMKLSRIGYGAGSKDLEQPNVLRLLLGETGGNSDFDEDIISVLETNIDDMNPQFYETTMSNLLAAGALDVFISNILMKKNRPAHQLTVLCTLENENKIAKIIFQNTSSIGVRIRQEKRKKLKRELNKVQTEFGEITVKISRLNGKILNMTPEYEDCKKIAQSQNIPLKKVYEIINRNLRVENENF